MRGEHDSKNTTHIQNYASVVGLTLFFATVFSLCNGNNTYQTGQRVKRQRRSSPEAVLESPRHALEVLHPSCAGGLSTLGFLAPLVRAQLGRWVAALSACCEESLNIDAQKIRWNQIALLCCLWKARFPQRRQSVWDLVCLLLWYANRDQPCGIGE